MKPVWLLDVDGVLNAISKRPPRSVWPAEEWIQFDATNRYDGVIWPLLVAQPVVDFIRRTHQQQRAEIRWHTTWQEQARDIGAQLDLPEFPVQHAPEYATSHTDVDSWWKLPAAERVITDEGRALLWTDDDARFELAQPGARRVLVTGTTEIISPPPTCGLTPKLLRRIDAFLDLWRSPVNETQPAAGPIRPGQVWADNDWRSEGRTVRVDRVDSRYAYCTILTNTTRSQKILDACHLRQAVDRRGAQARILLSRMRPTSTGYRLVSQPKKES